MHKQILTVNVEDYFHVWALRGSNAVLRKHWDRLDPRLDASLRAVLELLERYGARATFFVFGCIADRQPQIVESIMARGHEIASRGYWPRSLKGFEPSEFVDDLGRAKEALEAAGSNRIVGYRSPAWIGREHLWMLDELIEQGYQYDSSINPILLRFAHDPFRWHVHQHWHTSKRAALWEVPISTASMFGLRVAISGGNYIRQLPHWALSRAVQHQIQKGPDPVVFYFMPWELDVGQPHIQGLSMIRPCPPLPQPVQDQARPRRLLGQVPLRWDWGLLWARLTRRCPRKRALCTRRRTSWPARSVSTAGTEPISLVVPMYNERQNISYLRRTLLGFRERLGSRYRIHLVLVDDASTDDTWDLVTKNFSRVPDCSMVRHPAKSGCGSSPHDRNPKRAHRDRPLHRLRLLLRSRDAGAHDPAHRKCGSGHCVAVSPPGKRAERPWVALGPVEDALPNVQRRPLGAHPHASPAAVGSTVRAPSRISSCHMEGSWALPRC